MTARGLRTRAAAALVTAVTLVGLTILAPTAGAATATDGPDGTKNGDPGLDTDEQLARPATVDCFGQPGMTAMVVDGRCVRHLVPYPLTSEILPPGAPIPDSVLPAVELAEGEPAPAPFSDPVLHAVHRALPDGSTQMLRPVLPIGQKRFDPATGSFQCYGGELDGRLAAP